MDLYLNITLNRIIGVDLEKHSNEDICITSNTIEEFYDDIVQRGYTVDESIESEITEFFSNVDTEEPQFTIKHWVSNRSIGELIDMFDGGEIIKPTMQRNLIWDSLKSSRLIESVLMGLPIPPLFMIEIEQSKYELVDGLQRLSAFTNYIYGYSWSGNKETKRPSKLSQLVMKSIAGKSFKDLTPDQQRILKRSTIPLVEFKQLEPDNTEAKYLIFERINTGSVKLTGMQIRKALAYGKLMESLYYMANNCEAFLSLFTTTDIKKDAHVEAALRVIVMSEIHDNSFETKETNIGKILNAYCEKNRNMPINHTYVENFRHAVDVMINIFNERENVCRRVMPGLAEPHYSGGLQVSILEALLGTIIKYKINDVDGMEERYRNKMVEMFKKIIRMEMKTNPFSYSTGTREAIDNRFKFFEEMLLENDN